MPASIIDGKKYASQILDEVRTGIGVLRAEGKRPPCLAVILVGDDPASSIYVRNKRESCRLVGIESRKYALPKDTSQTAVLELIARLNADGEVDGILAQSPMPRGIDRDAVMMAIDPAKDADGFHPHNMGLLAVGVPGILPCTPAGIIEMLRRDGVKIEGARCVVVGRSNIVGKPAALMLLRENATVTVCHSRTADLASATREADILVAALGKRAFIKPDMVKEGAVIVDVGIHRIEGTRKITGDTDPACAGKAARITPVPGGVGPMTVAMLMKNCLAVYKARCYNG